jgi:hypothetical protein
MTRHHNINGNIVPFTAEEEAQRDAEELAYDNGAFDRAIADLRQKRNSLLTATDYLALSDNTLTTAMTTYRTALRNLPNGLTTVADCEDVTWPTKP